MEKRIFAVILTIVMLAVCAPGMAVGADKDPDEKLIGSGNLVLDTNAAGGYEGDYVVIYNPSTSSSSSCSTGNMSGLIETTVEPYGMSNVDNASDELNIIDVDSLIAEQNKNIDNTAEPAIGSRDSYNVGDTRNFNISSYSPGGSTLQFKCVAVGDHCYVWTPSQNITNYYPLDVIDPTYPQIVADEFDSKYAQMTSSFGNHDVGGGDGRVNLMYYNIDDGFNPATSNSYVAGYFSSADYYNNDLPMIHIDTYPGVYYVNTDNVVTLRLSRTFGVFCHEYQHLINYSITGGMDTWLNECMSAAAEEICYPGSSISPRIQSWEHYYYSDNGDWLTPPAEFEYYSEYELHNGFSMYDWSNYIDYVLPLYSQVSLFSQYLFTHYGNSIFRTITSYYSSSGNAVTAIASATGGNTSDIVKNFRIALTANDPTSFNGLYGFNMQDAYDPDEYNGVENLYNLLAPIVFTGSTCSIYGGGSITVKPINGVYNPPSGASSSLVYIGVTRNLSTEPVALTGMELDCDSLTMYTGYSSSVSVIRTPINANDFTVEWNSTNSNIVQITSSGKSAAILYGAAVGNASVTCTATDNASGARYTDTVAISVLYYPTLGEAANVDGGSLVFTSTTTNYPWAAYIGSDGRACVKSGNAGVNSSSSSLSTTVTLSAGDSISFEWRVSSETNYDLLEFYVNGVKNGSSISGTGGAWSSGTYTASTDGTYTFMWKYSKDVSVDSGDDCGYVDNVEVTRITPVAVLGDVNGNGVVDSADALLVMRYTLRTVELSAEQLELADYNSDGNVDTTDALLIFRKTLGLIA